MAHRLAENDLCITWEAVDKEVGLVLERFGNKSNIRRFLAKLNDLW